MKIIGTSLAIFTLATHSSALQYHELAEDEVPPECEDWREYVDDLRELPKCGNDRLVGPGDLCEGGRAGTGTSNQVNNCGPFDLYKAGEAADHSSALQYRELAEDEVWAECDDWRDILRQLRAIPKCGQVDRLAPGDVCEGGGRQGAGTSNDVDNCGPYDLYTVEVTGGGSGGGPITPAPAPVPASPSTPTAPGAPFVWPAYSQQCRDDAGPVIGDDAEIFGKNGHYHDRSDAEAVLKAGGECATPVKAACEARAGNGRMTNDITRAAYLEGPLQCGGKGWFCRILPDPNHDGGDQSDWNYNHCNRTRYGDSDGHCHGSDDDDVYYWWVRDHWHRNYAGRLHCCCDWEATSGVVSRCDYRAPLQPGENRRCRDANEDHSGPGSGMSKGFEAGCPALGPRANPLPEPREDQCWDVLGFAPGRRGGL